MPSCLPTNGHDDVGALLLWGRNSRRAYLPDQVPETTIRICQMACVMMRQPWRAIVAASVFARRCTTMLPQRKKVI